MGKTREKKADDRKKRERRGKIASGQHCVEAKIYRFP